MHTKFVTFVFISTFLIAGIYSSSMSVVFALPPRDGYVETCTNTLRKDGSAAKTTCCIQRYSGGQVDGKPHCTTTCYNKFGEEQNCPKRTAEEDMVDPGLLGNGTLKGESQNTTKVPKSDLLNDGGILKGQDGNQTTSQRIVNPEDRFCKEGTGGQTGSPCVPCNPGKVDCIDVVTGGPLDMQTAPSESGKSNDTKGPKDLGGLNDDENGPSVNPGSD